MENRENQNRNVVAVTVRIMIPSTDISKLTEILEKVQESVQEYPDADVSLSTMRPRELRR